LQGETEYEFKVCAVDDEGNDGPFSFYNWNIVESGVKHRKPKPNPIIN
jgi:hypothetical protein